MHTPFPVGKSSVVRMSHRFVLPSRTPWLAQRELKVLGRCVVVRPQFRQLAHALGSESQ